MGAERRHANKRRVPSDVGHFLSELVWTGIGMMRQCLVKPALQHIEI